MQKSGGWARYMLQYAFNAFKQIKIIKCRNFCCGILWSRLISPLCKSGCSASSLAGPGCRSLLQGSSCAEVFCNLRKLLHFSLLFSEMTRYTRKMYSALCSPMSSLTILRLNSCRVSSQTSNVKRTAVSFSVLPVYTHVFVNNSDVCCSFYCCRQLSIVKTSICPAPSYTRYA